MYKAVGVIIGGFVGFNVGRWLGLAIIFGVLTPLLSDTYSGEQQFIFLYIFFVTIPLGIFFGIKYGYRVGEHFGNS